jgi:hypothetical protein
LAFNPSLQIASQSNLDCSEAAGEVNSIFLFDQLMFVNPPTMTHIVNTKVVQCLGNLNLLGGVEESIRKLLSLT